jgi:hypothetical protein
MPALPPPLPVPPLSFQLLPLFYLPSTTVTALCLLPDLSVVVGSADGALSKYKVELASATTNPPATVETGVIFKVDESDIVQRSVLAHHTPQAQVRSSPVSRSIAALTALDSHVFALCNGVVSVYTTSDLTYLYSLPSAVSASDSLRHGASASGSSSSGGTESPTAAASDSSFAQPSITAFALRTRFGTRFVASVVSSSLVLRQAIESSPFHHAKPGAAAPEHTPTTALPTWPVLQRIKLPADRYVPPSASASASASSSSSSSSASNAATALSPVTLTWVSDSVLALGSGGGSVWTLIDVSTGSVKEWKEDDKPVAAAGAGGAGGGSAKPKASVSSSSSAAKKRVRSGAQPLIRRMKWNADVESGLMHMRLNAPPSAAAVLAAASAGQAAAPVSSAPRRRPSNAGSAVLPSHATSSPAPPSFTPYLISLGESLSMRYVSGALASSGAALPLSASAAAALPPAPPSSVSVPYPAKLTARSVAAIGPYVLCCYANEVVAYRPQWAGGGVGGRRELEYALHQTLPLTVHPIAGRCL